MRTKELIVYRIFVRDSPDLRDSHSLENLGGVFDEAFVLADDIVINETWMTELGDGSPVFVSRSVLVVVDNEIDEFAEGNVVSFFECFACSVFSIFLKTIITSNENTKC